MANIMKPTGQIKARLGIQPNGPVHKFFTNTCRRYMEKYVPMDNGTLREVVDEQDNKVIYQSPYAHYQYIGILYVDPVTGSSFARKDTKKVPTNKSLKYHTPGTGPYWDRRMVSNDINEVIKEVEEYIRR